jgi:hypothetical protein
LLFEIDTVAKIGIVNCTGPGQALAHMVDLAQDKSWRALLKDKCDDRT